MAPAEETLPHSALSPTTVSPGTSSVAPSPYTHSRDIESDEDSDTDVEELVLQDPDPSGDSAAVFAVREHPFHDLPYWLNPYLQFLQHLRGGWVIYPRWVNPGRKLKRQQQDTLETPAYSPPVVALTSSRVLTSNLSRSSLFSWDAEEEPATISMATRRMRSMCLLRLSPSQAPKSFTHFSQTQTKCSRRMTHLPKRPRKKTKAEAPSSRNRQTSSPATIELADQTGADLICPKCGWEQTNQRLPDPKRHLKVAASRRHVTAEVERDPRSRTATSHRPITSFLIRVQKADPKLVYDEFGGRLQRRG